MAEPHQTHMQAAFIAALVERTRTAEPHTAITIPTGQVTSEELLRVLDALKRQRDDASR
jgi:hypothetical protein